MKATIKQEAQHYYALTMGDRVIVGCKAWQNGATWEILCIVPKDKVNEVMNAYNDNFGW